jgi:hypothetical protein
MDEQILRRITPHAHISVRVHAVPRPFYAPQEKGGNARTWPASVGKRIGCARSRTAPACSRSPRELGGVR